MADRIVVMNAGRIEQEGPPLELYDRPANRFVASFLGSPSMGFIPGAIERRAGGVAFRAADGTSIRLRETQAEAGQAVEVGIRPEHFRLGDAGDGLPFLVEVIEPTGAETHVFGRLAGAEIRCVFHDRLNARPGDRLPLTVDPARVHVFDSGTGRRLERA